MNTHIEQLIKSTRGKFFSVDFVKKNGEVRHMIARTGVKKHIRGGGLSFNPQDVGLIVAFDSIKMQYRMINTETVFAFKCGNQTWRKAA